MEKKQITIIGAGFFGLYLAEHFALKGAKVTVCEKSDECMKRASYVNQARVHNGYHYPRSVLTALRSRVSFPRFCEEFPDCIRNDFDKYYMVGSILGKVTANQFERFCERIGAVCEPAPKKIADLVNRRLVEAVFRTKECAFDAVKLRERMLERVAAAGVTLRMKTSVDIVRKVENGLEVTVRDDCGESETLISDDVFNCTYAMLNHVKTEPRVDTIPLKHELTEMCLVEVPDELKDAGITVMCGPFFSVMPFPSAGLHSFSHVRYTPHAEWHEADASDMEKASPYSIFSQVAKQTAWNHIRLDASRYMPILNECRYDHSIWEVKTVLPKSEKDDSRPILFKPNYGIKGYHCVMGGKIDNVYDAVTVIEQKQLDQ